MTYIRCQKISSDYHHFWLFIILVFFVFSGCGKLNRRTDFLRQCPEVHKKLHVNWLSKPVAVFPLKNHTKKHELDWLAMGLQEILTDNLLCISDLHAKGLVDINMAVKQECPDFFSSCMARHGSKDNMPGTIGMKSLEDIAVHAGLGHFLWGDYQIHGDKIVVHVGLYSAPDWTKQREFIITAPLANLLRESSKKLLHFFNTLGIYISTEERRRILLPETKSVSAWRQDVLGYCCQQAYLPRAIQHKKEDQSCEFYFHRAIEIDPQYASARYNLGRQRIITGDLDSAVEAFQRALELRPDLIKANVGLGYCLYKKGNPEDAIPFLEQAVRLNPSLSEHYGCLMDAYKGADLMDNGIAMLNFLESFLRERNRQNERMKIISWRAEFLKDMNRFSDSEKDYNEVLSFTQSNLGLKHPETAIVLSNFAELLYKKGEYLRAKSMYDQALAIDENFYGPLHPEVAKDLNNLASLCYIMGEYAQAKVLYEHALTIVKKNNADKSPDAAHTLNNLAEVYQALGDYTSAENLYERALEIWKNTYGDEHPKVVLVLNNLAMMYKECGAYARAKTLYNRALKISEKINKPNNPEVAMLLNNLAGIYYETGDYTRAKALYNRALAIDKKAYGPDHPKVAIHLNNLAEVFYKEGNYTQANIFYEQALTIAEKSSYPELQWRVQFNLATLLSKQDNPYAAVFFGKQAVNTIQNLRTNIVELETELQRSFLMTKKHAYRFLADLLIDLGRLPEAQQILNMLKEKEYFDFLCRDTRWQTVQKTKVSYTDVELPWAEQYQKINSRIALLGREMAALKKKRKSSGLTPGEEQHYGEIKEDLKVAHQAFRAYIHEVIGELSSAPREQYVKISKLRLDKPRKLQQTLRELGYNAVVIHYLVTDEKLRIILTTPEVQLARDIAIPAKRLNHNIMAFRRILQKPRLSPFFLGKELYNIVLRPIESDLQQAGAETLMLCLDGSMRYIPFAALYNGKSYVGEHYRLAIYTPAAGLDIKDQPVKRWRAGGFGLTKGVRGFRPLPAVSAELEGIVRRDVEDPDGVLPGVIFLNEKFCRNSLESVLEDQYPVVHIASHFELKPGTIENSYLILGDGTLLTLNQVKNDDYDFRGIDLITLSACNTAIGEAGANGKEVESFGALVQDQGAKGVLATLWPVSDESTGIFMKNMYRLREEKEGITKAEALRQAQLMFIKGQKKVDAGNPQVEFTSSFITDKNEPDDKVSFTPDPQAPYAHPYYWAPFVLMGNWL